MSLWHAAVAIMASDHAVARRALDVVARLRPELDDESQLPLTFSMNFADDLMLSRPSRSALDQAYVEALRNDREWSCFIIGVRLCWSDVL